MPTTNFKLPTTKLCIVVWYRNGIKHETLINTPSTNEMLVTTMFQHRVGASELRAVKEVNPLDLKASMIAA